jgi:hypothetical protein
VQSSVLMRTPLCWLCPAGRLAAGGPVQQCPAEVSCAGCVLPSRPSPCRGLSPPLSTTRDKTPQAHAADCLRLPVGLVVRRSVEVPAWFRVRVSPSVPQELYPMHCRYLRTGAAGVSQVLRRLSSCLPWPEDAGGPPPPRPCGGARVACGSVQTLGVRNEPFRSCTSTSGGAVTPTASRIRCRRFAHLVRRESPHDSAMDARLDTGGWLTLTRQGLSPCQRRQAYLGAITLGLRRRQWPERGTSVGYWRSPAGRYRYSRFISQVFPWTKDSLPS